MCVGDWSSDVCSSDLTFHLYPNYFSSAAFTFIHKLFSLNNLQIFFPVTQNTFCLFRIHKNPNAYRMQQSCWIQIQGDCQISRLLVLNMFQTAICIAESVFGVGVFSSSRFPPPSYIHPRECLPGCTEYECLCMQSPLCYI